LFLFKKKKGVLFKVIPLSFQRQFCHLYPFCSALFAALLSVSRPAGSVA
jgi:hypothetical protein